MRTTQTPIRPRDCAGQFESSLGADSRRYFSHVAAHIIPYRYSYLWYGICRLLCFLTNYRLEISLYVKLKDWMSNSIDPDETAHYEPSRLHLRCLQKPIIIVAVIELTLRQFQTTFVVWFFFFFFFFFDYQLEMSFYVKMKDWMSYSVDPHCLQTPTIIANGSEFRIYSIVVMGNSIQT